MEDSKIAWTDNTFNPWIGCTRVSAGCEHCYAEVQNNCHKWNGGTWGHKAPRKVTSDKYWRKPLAWNAKAAKMGERLRVFCASLADIFDDNGPISTRKRLWELVRRTPNLDWLILTKRPENFQKYLPRDWGTGYPNVWLGVTCENRKEGFPRVEVLRRTPAKVRFLSCEPLLEDTSDVILSGIDWVIVGGESGPGSREFKIEWARRMRDRCAEAGVPFFMKQLGSSPSEAALSLPVLHKTLEGKIDVHGSNPANFPSDLQIQAWPDSGALAPVAEPSPTLTTGQKAAATRKRNDAARRNEDTFGSKPGLHIIGALGGKEDLHPQASGLPFEGFKHVVKWLNGWVEANGPMGHVATAALSSFAALTEMLDTELRQRTL